MNWNMPKIPIFTIKLKPMIPKLFAFPMIIFLALSVPRIDRSERQTQPVPVLQRLNSDFTKLMADSVHVQASELGFTLSSDPDQGYTLSIGFEPIAAKKTRDRCTLMKSALTFVALCYRNVFPKYPIVKKMRLFSPIKGREGQKYEEYYLWLPGGQIAFCCEGNSNIQVVDARKIPNYLYH
ncbi:hypothetical protein [Puia dinghuensis]|uniref:hypothetical protein n=1 Tax=Puia dinghuensis TaxID=1792502 RepID=UPI001662A7BE|nr:hypothetical protein [Puia dinghuensis]